MRDLRAVPSLPDYFASDDGTVWSVRGGRALHQLSQDVDHQGYPTVRVYTDRRKRPIRRKVPRIIAEAFHGPRPEGLQIRHLDGDPANNRPENLQYGTAAENHADKVRHGTHQLGIRAHNAVHTDAEVTAAVQMVIDGYSQTEAAARFFTTQVVISSWCLGKCRRNATRHLDLSGLKGKRARGEHFGVTKVSDAQLAQMKLLRADGVKMAVLADMFGVHPATASKLSRGLGRAA